MAFDERKAQRVIKFIQALKHTKGEFHGVPFDLLPWQEKIIREGNVVHYGFIEQFICQLGEKYNIREIAHDRWNATMMVQQLEEDGFTMVPFGQGFRDMSPQPKN